MENISYIECLFWLSFLPGPCSFIHWVCPTPKYDGSFPVCASIPDSVFSCAASLACHTIFTQQNPQSYGYRFVTPTLDWPCLSPRYYPHIRLNCHADVNITLMLCYSSEVWTNLSTGSKLWLDIHSQWSWYKKHFKYHAMALYAYFLVKILTLWNRSMQILSSFPSIYSLMKKVHIGN